MNLLLDGNNIAHRCYWISEKQPEKLTSPDGVSIGCVYVFLNSIKSFIKGFNTTNVYTCWDKKLTYPSTNFRSEMTKGSYKGQRSKDNMESLYDQIHIIEQILPSLGIKNIFPNILEGDDVISYLSTFLDGPNMIISVDQDLLQLIDKKTSFYDLNKKNIIDIENFEKYVDIKPQYFLKYKAILGDKSDNIKGLPGFGKVKAKKLSENWDTLKDKLDPNSLSIVEENQKLIDLKYGYSIYPNECISYEEQLKHNNTIVSNINTFKEYCVKYGFNSYLTNLKEWDIIFKKKSDLSNLFS